MYVFDSNAIMVEPLKTCQGKKLATAFYKLYTKLKFNKNESNIFILDYECSSFVKDTIHSYNVQYQLAPPHQHRQNAAENAIKTIKSHFLSGLATCDKNFPITEWDRLIPLAELKLNLLQNSRINPNLSSWASIGKNFCGLNITWDYAKGWVGISMKTYVNKTLRKLLHKKPSRAQHAPHKWSTPIYGQTRQFATPPDTSEILDTVKTKQNTSNKSLAVYCTMR